MHIILYLFRPFNGFYGCISYVLPIMYCLMQKHTPGMFMTDFRTRKCTGSIISRVGILKHCNKITHLFLPFWEFCINRCHFFIKNTNFNRDIFSILRSVRHQGLYLIGRVCWTRPGPRWVVVPPAAQHGPRAAWPGLLPGVQRPQPGATTTINRGPAALELPVPLLIHQAHRGE